MYHRSSFCRQEIFETFFFGMSKVAIVLRRIFDGRTDDDGKAAAVLPTATQKFNFIPQTILGELNRFDYF